MRISDWSSDVCSSDVFDVDAGVVLRDHAARCRHAAPPAAGHAMIATTLFIVFIVLMVIGMPVGVALGIAGTLAIVMSNLDTQWFGLLAVPQSFYAGLAKYPLLAIPMFVLVGSIFDRSGVASRLVNFAISRSEEHTSELQSLMRISYAVFCLKKKK